MGYTEGWHSKEELIAELLTYCENPVAHAETKCPHGDYKASLWVLTPKNLIVFWIGVNDSPDHPKLMGRWGYRDQSVSMGPHDHSCPTSLVAAASPSCFGFYGRAWLAKWGAAQKKEKLASDKLTEINTPELALA